ncbi:MAG: hypothetical protein FWC22_05940 [Treponema sp.]|nr:hypothetical protein [Treponema sp.]
MKKFISALILIFISFNSAFAQRYIPPSVEDTPEFKRLKVMVEADGYPYSHYETGVGLIVWGKRSDGSGKGWGSKNEGIVRIPGNDQNKAYTITWTQYFLAFSEMHKACFEDINVRKIKEAVDQIVRDTDYDYANLFKAPGGAKWVFHPDVKNKGVCDDYANLVTEKVSGLPGVSKVTKVSSRTGNHSWNEIHLTDGRIIYCDATWYDTNGYNKDPKTGNYIIDHEPHYMPTMFTFNKELFSLGKTHYEWGDAK